MRPRADTDKTRAAAAIERKMAKLRETLHAIIRQQEREARRVNKGRKS